MSEQFKFNNPEVKKETMFPEDFPMYNRDYRIDESTRAGMENDDKKMFFDNKGELDEIMATRMWYATANAAKINTYNIPVEDPLNIAIGGFLALKGINFDKCFSKSGAYRAMACLPENDLDRQKLLDFQADLVMRSLLNNVKKIADDIPELREAAERFVRAKIQYDADRLRSETLSPEKKEESLEISEKIKEEYLSAEQEFDKVMIEQNIQY